MWICLVLQISVNSEWARLGILNLLGCCDFDAHSCYATWSLFVLQASYLTAHSHLYESKTLLWVFFQSWCTPLGSTRFPVNLSGKIYKEKKTNICTSCLYLFTSHYLVNLIYIYIYIYGHHKVINTWPHTHACTPAHTHTHPWMLNWEEGKAE